MNKTETFIEKWNVGFEDYEQKMEFASEMRDELQSIKEHYLKEFIETASKHGIDIPQFIITEHITHSKT